MVMGKTFLSSSSLAMSMGLVTPSGTSIRTGAPRLIWRARAPITLAFSNLVSLGGPIIDILDSIVFNPQITLQFSTQRSRPSPEAGNLGSKLKCKGGLHQITSSIKLKHQLRYIVYKFYRSKPQISTVSAPICSPRLTSTALRLP